MSGVTSQTHSQRALPPGLVKCLVALLLIFAFSVAGAQSSESPSYQIASPTHAKTPTASRTYSPTPSRTNVATQVRAPAVPRAVPGQLTVDANTIALYHFDSPSDTLAIDATGNYTGTFHNGAANIANGLYSGALYLDRVQQSYVNLGNYGELPQGTIEMYVDFARACTLISNPPTPTVTGHFTLLSAGNGFGGAQNLWVGVDTGMLFKVYVNGNWQWVDSGINPCRYLVGGNLSIYWQGLTPYPANTWPYETWRMHHVAITWGPRGLEFWVDGILHGVSAGTTPEALTFAYRCNPQMQLTSWLYPVCATPAINNPALYSYRGGLPPYSTMLLGCDTPGNCFLGVIDEVRVSNIQRTFTTSVIPTLTPVPTQTPVAPTGEYAVDGVTSALYHLNSSVMLGLPKTLDEVSQTYDALAGEATIGAGGKFGNALILNGHTGSDWGTYMDMVSPPIYPTGTLEAWVKLDTMPTLGAIMNGGGVYKSAFNNTRLQLSVYQSGGNNYLRFGLWIPSTGDWAWAQYMITPTFLTSEWHHIAATWGPRGLELWIDGILRATNPYTGYPVSIDTILVGCDQIGNCIVGRVDEVRVSTLQRTFSQPITPTPTRTLIPTPGLYHLPFVER